MPGESIVINQFERAASADINNLQRLGARSMTEIAKWLGTLYRYPAAVPVSGAVQSSDPESWCLGLVVSKASTTQYAVSAGLLCTATPTNLTLGDFSSSSVVGYQRAPVTRNLPVANVARTGGEWYLISARVVEIVALNTLVEIFDVPTQTFVPTAKDKRIEYQIEFREDAGPQVAALPTIGALPSLTAAPAGQGWVPIAAVKVYPDTGTAEHGQVIDLRVDLRDLVRSAPLDPFPTSNALAFPPSVSVRRIEGGRHPADQDYDTGFRGFFRASLQGREYSFALPFYSQLAASLNARIFRNALETMTDGDLTHIYLVPYKSGTMSRVPSWGFIESAPFDQSKALRGFLVACQDACPPTRDGKNSAAIRLPESGGPWAIFDEFADIAAHEAVHVFSAQSVTAATSLAFLPFVQSGGRLVYALNASPASGNSGPAALNNQTLAEGSTVAALNLAAFVPPNARWVELGIRITNGGTASGGARCEVKIGKEDAKIGGTTALAGALVMDAESIDCGHANTEWWGRMRVPLLTPNPADAPGLNELSYLSLAIEFEYQVLSGGTFGSAAGYAYVIGWDLGQ